MYRNVSFFENFCHCFSIITSIDDFSHNANDLFVELHGRQVYVQILLLEYRGSHALENCRAVLHHLVEPAVYWPLCLLEYIVKLCSHLSYAPQAFLLRVLHLVEMLVDGVEMRLVAQRIETLIFELTKSFDVVAAIHMLLRLTIGAEKPFDDAVLFQANEQKLLLVSTAQMRYLFTPA